MEQTMKYCIKWLEEITNDYQKGNDCTKDYEEEHHIFLKEMIMGALVESFKHWNGKSMFDIYTLLENFMDVVIEYAGEHNDEWILEDLEDLDYIVIRR